MKTEITPELLADLKDRAKVIKQGLWVFQKDSSDYYPEHQFFTTPTRDPLGSDGGNVTFNTADNDFFNVMDFIAAANPAVILALIAKIEELESENKISRMGNIQYFEWLIYLEQLMFDEHDVCVNRIRSKILDKVRELVANAKTNP